MDDCIVDLSNSGDVHQERPLLRTGNVRYRIRISPECRVSPPLDELRTWALDHYSAQIEAGLIARHFDVRRN